MFIPISLFSALGVWVSASRWGRSVWPGPQRSPGARGQGGAGLLHQVGGLRTVLPAWNDTAINALIRLSVLFVFYTIVNLIYISFCVKRATYPYCLVHWCTESNKIRDEKQNPERKESRFWIWIYVFITKWPSLFIGWSLVQWNQTNFVNWIINNKAALKANGWRQRMGNNGHNIQAFTVIQQFSLNLKDLLPLASWRHDKRGLDTFLFILTVSFSSD